MTLNVKFSFHFDECKCHQYQHVHMRFFRAQILLNCRAVPLNPQLRAGAPATTAGDQGPARRVAKSACGSAHYITQLLRLIASNATAIWILEQKCT